MNQLTTWLLVFLRASAMLSIFPIFSTVNFPVQLRVALGALLSALVSVTLPPTELPPDMLGLVGLMAMEIGAGLLIGFASRMVFYAVEIGASIIGIEIGLSMPTGVLPGMDHPSNATGDLMYYLAAMIWLSLDMHHWMILAFQKTYAFLPIGSAHLIAKPLMGEILAQTSNIFIVALQLAAPQMAVAFIILLIFSTLGRAIPQMNVFRESLSVRPLIGLSVFGLTMQLTSQHIINYMRHLPNDMLRVAQLLRAG